MLNEVKSRKAGKRQRNLKLFEPALIKEAIAASFTKLNPREMMKNPVMFTVEIGTVIMMYVTFVSISPNSGQGSFIYNLDYYNSSFAHSIVCKLCRSNCRSKR